ncbi:hypothetical protein FPV67DRAFT_1409893 [Lyophyllum atratum]|nr:hypothetical protein FPV67DRAFT_1409893 [Lyophyllum atratum]
MSRGDRVVASGNLSHSMRENYQQGVSEYYGRVGSVYRNPHFPGIRRCLFQWLNKWWQMESASLGTQDEIIMFDMACGIGEATVAFQEWWELGRKIYEDQKKDDQGDKALTALPQKKTQITPPPISSDLARPKILAADPFTSVAYHDRTSLPCSALSFKDISEGSLPPISPGTSGLGAPSQTCPIIDLVLCSFALHLVETPSELFSLLWELSSKVRWLVILAPHKKPEIKEGWGWSKWNVDSWTSCRMTDTAPEILNERVHCRVYRSVNT